MAEENVSQVKEMITDENRCLDDAKPMEIIDVHLPPATLSNGNVNLRRYSTGVLDKRGPSKPLVAQTRYRGNSTSSTHDVCKHGKRRDDDLEIKPWKLVKKKNVESGGDSGTCEALRRKSLVNVSRPEKSLQSAKREAAASEIVKKTSLDVKMVSRISENKSCKEDVPKKSVLRKSEKKSSKDQDPKEKGKTKIDEPVRCDDDALEKTLYVVESINIEEKKKKKKSIKSEIQKSSEKRILRGNGTEIPTLIPSLSPSSEKKKTKSEIQKSSEKIISRGSEKRSPTLIPSLSSSSEKAKEPRITRSDPRPIRQSTSVSEKKESGSAILDTNSKTESKIRPKRIGLKVTPPPPGPSTKPLSFKKGKVLEPKPEGSAPTLIKYKKRVVQEPKLKSSDGNKRKKNLLTKREGGGKMSNINGEGKREKVVLKHRKVEAKKKLQTLFNNVIEETVNKLEEVRKSKVQALVGAFETVISLQDDKTKTSQNKKKSQSKSSSLQGK